MAQTFHCPNCSAPLDYDGDDYTVRCPYCNSSAIVPDSLRSSSLPGSASSTPQIGGSSPWVGSSLLSQSGRLKEIAQHIRSGNKIEAVNIYRDTFNVGLNEAREAVDALEAGRPVLMPGSTTVGTPVTSFPSNPAITTTFTPNVISTSVKGTAYTASGKVPPTSFLVHWIRLSIASLPIAFVPMMLGLVFPNTGRLAAPVVCPTGYLDAFGEVEVTHDSDGTGYSLVVKCIDNEGQVKEVNGFLAGLIMLSLYWAGCVALAFGVAALLRFQLAGCIPLLAILVILPVSCLAYVSLIPSRSGQNGLLTLFGFQAGAATTSTEESTITLTQIFSIPFEPEVSPTPSFAAQLLVIGGEEGSGPGQFNDTRTIAVDGSGHIYTADYSDGRIQVFDSAGQFVTMWQIVGDNVYISGLAADSAGTLYVVYGGNINRFEGGTGTSLGKLPYDGSYFDDVAVSPQGDIVAVSDEEIVRFDSAGNQTLRIANWADSITNTFPAGLDNLTVDAEGAIYIADFHNSAVYKFSPDGQFIEQFDGGKQIDSPRAIAVDSRGRLYVHDNNDIQVFDKSGARLGTIDVEGIGFDLTMTAQDELYFMDRNANKVFKYKVP